MRKLRCRASWPTVAVTLLAPLVAAAPATPLAAQAAVPVAAPDDPAGVVGAGLLLRQLDGVKRVLMIAAHPDDEDTALLAALARGQGAQTAYLSLTRGEGGQNLIGPELGEGLGLVRTGELLAARELDGAEQFFTRAIDYGFSKSAEEAFGQWDREALLEDVVRVIRTFRPQVVVSVFSGTPRDGHGQHQAAGILAHEAFAAAGEAGRFPGLAADGLEPWQSDKLYRLVRRGGEPTLEVPTGVLDPLLGRSHHQIAMASRSEHRSQAMGTGQPLGPRSSALELAEVAPGVPAAAAEGGLFAGVDTSLAGIARANARPDAAAPLLAAIEAYRAALDRAGSDLNALRPWQAAAPLAEARRHLERAWTLARGGAAADGPSAYALDRVLEPRANGVERALLDVAGIVTDVRLGDGLLVPGQEAVVHVELWNAGPFAVGDARPALRTPAGWETEPLGADAADAVDGGFFRGRGGARAVGGGESTDVAPGESVVWSYRVRLPEDAEPSVPYFLRRPADGAMYRWPDAPGVVARPLDPPPLRGAVTLGLGVEGGPVSLTAERVARHVRVSDAEGELSAPVLVVPALSVEARPEVLVVPVGGGAPDARDIDVALRAYAPGATSGTLRLDVPAGWGVEPAAVDFTLAEGEETTARFRVQPPSAPVPGRVDLTPVATTASGADYRRHVQVVDYPHIDRTLMLRPGAARVTLVDVAVDPGLSVGYVVGSGDAVPDAIRQLGVDVELLDAQALRAGDLDRFDVIVLGIRAYETRPDLLANNQRLLDWVRRGGTAVVQYNTYGFAPSEYLPFPASISRPHDRVTDETADPAFLEPESPPLADPNDLDPGADFEGWVTERGLYFFGEWDEAYTPVLAWSDVGEEPKAGSLLVAPLGEGLWVYTGISFFRQLPAGVPGAYRLFANLLSLDREEWDAWTEGAR